MHACEVGSARAWQRVVKLVVEGGDAVKQRAIAGGSGGDDQQGRADVIDMMGGADRRGRQLTVAIEEVDGLREEAANSMAMKETGSSWLAAVIDGWLQPHRIWNELDALAMMDGADGPKKV
ncbi:hypothetical protein ACLOJK_022976 [Asimina triloba]